MLNFILIWMKGILNSFNIYAKEYPFIAGSISLWGLGTLSYLLKNIPRDIWSIIKKFSTTTITLTNSNDSFYLFLKWYEQNGYAKKGRYVKIENGRWGEGSMVISLGYGQHYFWYKKRLIIINMKQKIL